MVARSERLANDHSFHTHLAADATVQSRKPSPSPLQQFCLPVTRPCFSRMAAVIGELQSLLLLHIERKPVTATVLGGGRRFTEPIPASHQEQAGGSGGVRQYKVDL